MSWATNKLLVRKMVEAINTRNLVALDELMASDLVLHMHAQQTQGWNINKRVIEDEIKAFPDFHITIEDIIADGEKVWVRFTETGTHRGTYHGFAPTGNTLSYTVVAIWRTIEGKIVEGWIVYDQLEFLQQLGFLKYPKFPDEVP